MAGNGVVPAYRLLVNGQDAHQLSGKILEIAVTLQLNSVDEISVTLAGIDPDRLGELDSDVESVKLYDKLRVALGYGNALQDVIEGEVTAIEASFSDEGEATLRLQGHSPLHDLLRERRTRTFTKVKDSDIVKQIAGDHGLAASADETSVLHDYAIQANRTDLDFLLERAAAANFDLWFEEGSVVFRPAGTLETEIGSLAWGDTLLSFTPRLDSREEIRQVTVRGYDPAQKAAITGTWNAANRGRVETLAEPTVSTVAEASDLAQAIGAAAQGRRVTGSASILGDPKIRPGRSIQLRGIGRRFSGRYKITRATHRYGADGYRTELDVQGKGS